MKRQTREEQRTERESQNMLLHAYGYHWKRTEQLTTEQWSAAIADLTDPADRLPDWTLLSPLDMPIRDTTILRWLGECGTSSEDVLAFISDRGFTALGKDERRHWHILTPSGNTVNLKQALQETERIRLDRAKTKKRAKVQKIQESLERSALSLKETLALYGHATNEQSAWGYSPYPAVKRLHDGTIEVRTYHFESEWRTTVCQTEAAVVNHLYVGEEGYWGPGSWVESI